MNAAPARPGHEWSSTRTVAVPHHQSSAQTSSPELIGSPSGAAAIEYNDDTCDADGAECSAYAYPVVTRRAPPAAGRNRSS